MANGNKVLVLGLEGMEPYTTKRMMDAAGVRYYRYQRTGRKIEFTV